MATTSGKQRVRRFKVPRRFDGAPFIKIEIVVGGVEPLIRVRPARRRQVVEIPLGDVAEIVLQRNARAVAAKAAQEKKARKTNAGRSR